MRNHHHARVLPPSLEPLIQQSLLNLAVKGARVIYGDVDLTEVVRGDADDVNAAYEEWLARWRDLVADPSAAPASFDRRARNEPRARV